MSFSLWSYGRFGTCTRCHFNVFYSKPEQAHEVQLGQQPAGGDETLDPYSSQLYEEIKESDTATVAHTTEAVSSSGVTAPVPEYEDALLVEEAQRYQITQCSAYGVSLNN